MALAALGPGMDSLSLPSGGTPLPGRSDNAVAQLEAEMKLLHWHKTANEAALKAALLRTKKLRKMDQTPPKQSLQEKAAWMQQVIEEEQSKPLQVSKDFIKQHEERERVEEEKLDLEVQRHIEVLQRLRTKVKERDELRVRKERYREARAVLIEEKRAVGSMPGALSRSVGQASQPEPPSASPGPRKVQGTLTSVISSLDKLVDLERRISSLEHDNLYDKLTESRKPQPGASSSFGGGSMSGGGGGGGPSQPPARARRSKTELTFTRKKMGATANGLPARTYYSVKITEKRARKTRQALAGPKPGAALAAAKSGRARGGGHGSRTFMTSLPDHEHGGGGGGGGARTRMRRDVTRDRRTNTRTTGGTKQDKVINAWLNQKKQRVNGGGGGRTRREQTTGKGASGTRKYANKSMQQFHDLRGDMEKRKAEMRKNLRKGVGVGGASRRGVQVAGTTTRAGRSTRGHTQQTAGRGMSMTVGAGSMPAVRGARPTGAGIKRSHSAAERTTRGTLPAVNGRAASRRANTDSKPRGRAMRQAW